MIKTLLDCQIYNFGAREMTLNDYKKETLYLKMITQKANIPEDGNLDLLITSWAIKCSSYQSRATN